MFDGRFPPVDDVDARMDAWLDHLCPACEGDGDCELCDGTGVIEEYR